MKFCQVFMFVATAMVATQSFAQSEPDQAFIKHPTHCANFLGGKNYEGESVTVDFSQQLHEAVNAIMSEKKVQIIEGLRELTKRCTEKQKEAGGVAAS